MLLPFLGLADFHTKGEPREALVAMAMLESGDWILPLTGGGEIPYKPPFFHWLVALFSLPAGHVTEYTSRLPSALALILLAAATLRFFHRQLTSPDSRFQVSGSRRSDAPGAPMLPLLVALVTLTSFELWRAAMNARVDMVLTFLTVASIYRLLDHHTLRRIPWGAVLLMSCATLTKGPVGIIIPCLCAGLCFLLQRHNFFRVFLMLLAVALLSQLLPLCWYAAAYSRGGEEFLQLAIEENFGRMTGTMGYDVHIHPWTYNLTSLLSGFLPWTFVPLLLFPLLFRRLPRITGSQPPVSGFRFPVSLSTAVCVLTIFIFYCMPAGKRSVYLMPLYPFAAWWLAMGLKALKHRLPGALRALQLLLATLAIALPLLFVMVKTGLITPDIALHGKHALQNRSMLEAVASYGGFLCWASLAVSFGAGAFLLGGSLTVNEGEKKRTFHAKGSTLATAVGAVCIYIGVAGAIQPPLLNAKSSRPNALFAEQTLSSSNISPLSHLPSPLLYEFISHAEESNGDPERQYELNFYLGDRIRNFRSLRPEEGWLVISREDSAQWIPRFQKEGYTFDSPRSFPRPLLKRPSLLIRFQRN